VCTALHYFTKIATISTKKSVRTIALDENTHRIYLPTADMEPVPNGRPKMIAGSFQLLVFGEK
jgi:hypothetical protein